MKPKILIYGHWNEYDSRLDSPYQFDHAGYAHIELPKLTQEQAAEYSRIYDLIIIAPFGADTAWCADKWLEANSGDGHKLVLWSFDSHNIGWADQEALVAPKIKHWYTAHSQYVSTIGDNASWLPCCCTWLPVIKPVDEQNPSGRWIDFAAIMRKYPARAKIMDNFESCFSRMGKSFFIGEGDKIVLFGLYRHTKCVLNINLNNDLNIRTFEGLVSNASLLSTPSHDLANPLFDDLRDAVVTVSRDAGFEEFEQAANRALGISPNTEKVVRSKHMLFHRYCTIAKENL